MCPPPTSKLTIQEISDSFKFLIDTPEDLWLKSACIVSLFDWLLFCLSDSVWLVGESLLDPLDGVTEQEGLVLLLHLLERSLLHLLLQEVEDLDLKLRVQLRLLENVQLLNNLVKCFNLQLHSVGGGDAQEGSDHVLHHFLF